MEGGPNERHNMETLRPNDGSFVDGYCAEVGGRALALAEEMLPMLREGIPVREFDSRFGHRQMAPGISGSDFLELLQLDGVVVMSEGAWWLVPKGTDTFLLDERFPAT